MRIGVVGDIHGNYQGLKEAVQQMGKIDWLLFTGDGFRELGQFVEAGFDVPVKGVRGNCDFSSAYPEEEVFWLEGHQVLLTHGHLYGVKHDYLRLTLRAKTAGINLVVFGHTHQPLSEYAEGLYLFNPGSLSSERSYLRPGYGLIEINPADGIKLLLQKL